MYASYLVSLSSKWHGIWQICWGYFIVDIIIMLGKIFHLPNFDNADTVMIKSHGALVFMDFKGFE